VRCLLGVPPIKELLKRTEEHLKGMVVPGTLFEECLITSARLTVTMSSVW
jgi:deoxyxylulose-5-phosphate synthase